MKAYKQNHKLLKPEIIPHILSILLMVVGIWIYFKYDRVGFLSINLGGLVIATIGALWMIATIWAAFGWLWGLTSALGWVVVMDLVVSVEEVNMADYVLIGFLAVVIVITSIRTYFKHGVSDAERAK